MRPVTAPNLFTIEDLEKDILKLCIGINAATSELPGLIREFDERAGWLRAKISFYKGGEGLIRLGVFVAAPAGRFRQERPQKTPPRRGFQPTLHSCI